MPRTEEAVQINPGKECSAGLTASHFDYPIHSRNHSRRPRRSNRWNRSSNPLPIQSHLIPKIHFQSSLQRRSLSQRSSYLTSAHLERPADYTNLRSREVRQPRSNTQNRQSNHLKMFGRLDYKPQTPGPRWPRSPRRASTQSPLAPPDHTPLS